MTRENLVKTGGIAMKKFEWKTIKQKIGKGKKKIIAVTIVLCLVAGVAGNAISKQGKSSAEESKAISTTVGTKTIKESVSGTGTISYADSTDIEVPADLEMSEILVSEGTYVEAGTMLATVDETSLAVCIADVEEAISELDSTITSELSSTTTGYVKAGVSGTVEKIYGEAGDSVADVMIEHGALMTIKNGEEIIKVIGSDGVISAINVSEGSTVSSSTNVMTLEADSQSGEYLQAVKDREELVDILETLISIKKNGGIVASVEGMVETINVEGASGSSSSDSPGSSPGASVSSVSDENDIALSGLSGSKTEESTNNNTEEIPGDEGSTDSTDKTVAYSTAGDYAIHNITAVTITNLAVPSVTSENTVTLIEYGTSELVDILTAGAGRIEGTTKDMEYADKVDAEDWTECSDEYTEVSVGTWYVRYKITGTETASEIVKVEITQSAEDNSVNTSGNSGSVSVVNDGQNNSVSTANDSRSNTNSTIGGSKGSGSSTTNTSSSSGTTSSYSAGNSSTSVSDSTGSSSTSAANSIGKNTSAASESIGKNTTSANGSADSTSSEGTTDDSSSASSNTTGKNGTSSSDSGKKSGASSSGSGSKSGALSSGGATVKSVSSSKSSSSSAGSSGSSSSSNSSVSMVSAFTIANGDKMKVTMNVDELDILTMEEGLDAEITLDAVSNKIFEGVITGVSGSTSSSNGTAQYPVEVTFDKTEEMLSGMNASVAVIIEEAENVLTVPLVAVSDEGRSSYVYTGYDESSGELTGKTEVELGMSDENSVEIKSGLSEGDVIYYQMQGSDSSDSKSSRGSMGGMGMPGLTGSGDMKMGGERPSGGNGGERPSGGNGGERPSGRSDSGRSKSN